MNVAAAEHRRRDAPRRAVPQRQEGVGGELSGQLATRRRDAGLDRVLRYLNALEASMLTTTPSAWLTSVAAILALRSARTVACPSLPRSLSARRTSAGSSAGIRTVGLLTNSVCDSWKLVMRPWKLFSANLIVPDTVDCHASSLVQKKVPRSGVNSLEVRAVHPGASQLPMFAVIQLKEGAARGCAWPPPRLDSIIATLSTFERNAARRSCDPRKDDANGETATYNGSNRSTHLDQRSQALSIPTFLLRRRSPAFPRAASRTTSWAPSSRHWSWTWCPSRPSSATTGGMSWMTGTVEMNTTAGGSGGVLGALGGMFKRVVSGGSAFLLDFTSGSGKGQVAFSTTSPARSSPWSSRPGAA